MKPAVLKVDSLKDGEVYSLKSQNPPLGGFCDFTKNSVFFSARMIFVEFKDGIRAMG